jgi:hypothetical protein
MPGVLEIDSAGLPLSWSQAGGKGWRMEFGYAEESTRTTPRRVRFSHPRDMEAVVIVRELARPEAFSENQLELPLPPGTADKMLRP